ncbi:hypothetical protein ACR8G9_22735, partial [Salmonella enterica subsp. enterica serovar Paratyphi A]
SIHFLFVNTYVKNSKTDKYISLSLYNPKMVDFECKAKMITSTTPKKSPKLSSKLRISVPPPIRVIGDSSPVASESDCLAYEHFIRLPELKKIWNSTEFPSWKNECILKPGHGLGSPSTYNPTQNSSASDSDK